MIGSDGYNLPVNTENRILHLDIYWEHRIRYLEIGIDGKELASVHKVCDFAIRERKALVLSHLEHCIQVWSPYVQEDIQCVENMWRVA